MQQLLISDTNIIIDLEDGRLINELFQLPYRFAVPDILFAEELEAHHGHLLALGLQQRELNPESMAYALQLVERYGGPSTHDCFALALARQERCPLITGDKRLRKAAEQEQVEKLGTLWILEQMLMHGIVAVDRIDTAKTLMRQAGSRLPWSTLETLLERYRTS